MTCRVVDVWEDGVSVLRLTKISGGLAKRPTERLWVPFSAFDGGKLQPTDPLRPSTCCAATE